MYFPNSSLTRYRVSKWLDRIAKKLEKDSEKLTIINSTPKKDEKDENIRKRRRVIRDKDL